MFQNLEIIDSPNLEIKYSPNLANDHSPNVLRSAIMLIMLEKYKIHNLFKAGLKEFIQSDPHLSTLSQQKYQYEANWWAEMYLDTPGIYILTGGRQVGKSTSCKLLIKHCLQNKVFTGSGIFYLPCQEIWDPKSLGQTIRFILEEFGNERFLLIIDEITFVENWDRVIFALAEEGYFKKGLCLLTGSDTSILKEAAVRFPGRRGKATKTDFHFYPLSFHDYVKLVSTKKISPERLHELFGTFLQCGGYLRAINDFAESNSISQATYLTYEQWIRGDILKRGLREETLLAIIAELIRTGVSQISYNKLTAKVGLIDKDTLIEYCNVLERMDVLFHLKAYDQNTKRGFPRKDRKFHFYDPFIYHVLYRWAFREGYLEEMSSESEIVEAVVASHCYRHGNTYYFKGQGEVDVIRLVNKTVQAIEVKWSNKLRDNDLKTLKQFKNAVILTKQGVKGKMDDVRTIPVQQYLYDSET